MQRSIRWHYCTWSKHKTSVWFSPETRQYCSAPLESSTVHLNGRVCKPVCSPRFKLFSFQIYTNKHTADSDSISVACNLGKKSLIQLVHCQTLQHLQADVPSSQDLAANVIIPVMDSCVPDHTSASWKRRSKDANVSLILRKVL